MSNWMFWEGVLFQAPKSVWEDGPLTENGGANLTVGTSERGSPVDGAELNPGFKNLLIVFGGVKGLESALEADEDLEGEDPEPLLPATSIIYIANGALV